LGITTKACRLREIIEKKTKEEIEKRLLDY